MGGSALKLVGIQPRRLQASEFPQLVSEVQRASTGLFHWLQPVKFHRDKADMGDIDFVGYPQDNQRGKEIVEWGEILIQRLGSKGSYYNKPVLSLEYKGVQIDVVAKYSDIEARTYLDFCEYAPIGNVVGRMLKQTGTKWGIDGLTYPVRESHARNENLVGSISLSTNMHEIMGLAGLDGEKWKAGFDTEEEIFAFCIESHLFNKEIFAYENLNHVNRKRDRLRTSYSNFLKYIADKPNNYERDTSDEERAAKKDDWFEKLCKMFPHSNLREERDKLIEVMQKRRALNQKFNGNVIREITGLAGKELGNFLTSFKAGFESPETYDTWVRQSTEAEIKSKVLETHIQPEISI